MLTTSLTRADASMSTFTTPRIYTCLTDATSLTFTLHRHAVMAQYSPSGDGHPSQQAPQSIWHTQRQKVPQWG
jgi:hypothetical protein